MNTLYSHLNHVEYMKSKRFASMMKAGEGGVNWFVGVGDVAASRLFLRQIRWRGRGHVLVPEVDLVVAAARVGVRCRP